MKNNMRKNGSLEFGEVSIPRFNEAYASFEKLGHQFMDAWNKWDHYYSIVEEYRLNGITAFRYNQKLYEAIIEDGIEYFEHREMKLSEKMFNAMHYLDKMYFKETGKHFKGFIDKRNHSERSEFLAYFIHQFDIYMSGGHQDVLVAVA